MSPMAPSSTSLLVHVALEKVVDPSAARRLAQLVFGSSPEVEQRLVALGIPRTLADDDKRRMFALIDAQEAQLGDWIANLKELRATVDR